MFGRLTLDAFKHDFVVMGGIATMILALIAIIIAITYFKKWTYLYKNWLTSLDNKKIGVMYIVVSAIMLLRGFMDAAMIRAQQAIASGNSEGFLSPDHFQQVFTAHGTMMIFFVAMGLMFGLINLILPLQIGARDVAFPYLNSISFYLFVAGAILMNTSLVIGEFSATGWLAYPPLSGLEYSPGVGVDYWLWSIQIAGIGSLLSGINFIITILKERAPGMTLMKMPIFVWSVLGAMILVIFAFPVLTATIGMLSLDRLLEMHFFTSDLGGNPMLYVNLIWAWGHPEVYILILPAFGVFSEVVATFSGKRLFGYKSMVIAIMLITILSYIVWLHHFFTMGGGPQVNVFFGIMTMIIAIPTGVKVFNWLFTMYRGRIQFTSPMLWFLAFVFTFTLGGVTGVMLAVPAIDFQVHNSLFLVAHFHNMIIGGVVFGYFAGLTYWFPKIFGFKLNERLGKLAVYFWASGFFFAFMPLYILGFMGATRRFQSYDPSLGWQGLFIVSAFGVALIFIGVLLQLAQLGYSIYKRKSLKETKGDSWGTGRTLEWAVASPAPSYDFAVIPKVTTRDAFWHMKHSKQKHSEPVYRAFDLPRNTPAGLIIGFIALAGGFAIIWHIWWLVTVSVIALITTVIVRSFNDDTTYTISVDEVKSLEKQRIKKHEGVA